MNEHIKNNNGKQSKTDDDDEIKNIGFSQNKQNQSNKVFSKENNEELNESQL